jgi:hypothetical protein
MRLDTVSVPEYGGTGAWAPLHVRSAGWPVMMTDPAVAESRCDQRSEAAAPLMDTEPGAAVSVRAAMSEADTPVMTNEPVPADKRRLYRRLAAVPETAKLPGFAESVYAPGCE